MRYRTPSIVGCCLLFSVPALTAAQPLAGKNTADDCKRLIVKYRDTDPSSMATTDQLRRLQSAAGHSLKYRRTLGSGAYLLTKGNQTNGGTDTRPTVARLRDAPEVEYAECDARRYITRVPNDPYYEGDLLSDEQQWYLHEPEGGVNADQAWNITLGNNTVVTAVVDSGILPHSDFDDTRLLDGYDFISDAETANDGDGRDGNPKDNGDYVTQEESDESGGPFEDCEVSDSSWHGTRIAGIVGAATDNQTGIAGVDWTGYVLPVRAIGRCGGYTSDIADAVRWAAGLSVPDVPDNPNPADVINLSLGSVDECTTTEREAIQAAVDAGALVVVAAGNEGGAVGDVSPANCGVDGMVVVAATTRDGGETCYTSFGGEVDLSAPGGNSGDTSNGCSGSQSDGLYSISNSGTEGPDPDETHYEYGIGTSFATPQATGTGALLRAAYPALTPVQMEVILKDSARAFPTGTADSFDDCNTQRCGAGILDINNALQAAGDGDAAPDAFAFEAVEDASRDASVDSNTVVIEGITLPSPIGIDNGEYRIDDGDFTAENGYIESGQSVVVRLTASADYASTEQATLNIGGVTGTFTVTTEAAPTSGSGTTIISSSGGGHPAGLLIILLGLLAFHFTAYKPRT